MAQQDPTLRELKLISKVLILTNAGAIERKLSKIATTNERKKTWVLTDGKRMPRDIADQAGVTQMAVSYFINAGAAAELIEYVKGKPPRRILDYVPPSWIDLIIKEKGEVEQEAAKEVQDAKDKTSEKESTPQPVGSDSTIMSEQQEKSGKK